MTRIELELCTHRHRHVARSAAGTLCDPATQPREPPASGLTLGGAYAGGRVPDSQEADGGVPRACISCHAGRAANGEVFWAFPWVAVVGSHPLPTSHRGRPPKAHAGAGADRAWGAGKAQEGRRRHGVSPPWQRSRARARGHARPSPPTPSPPPPAPPPRRVPAALLLRLPGARYVSGVSACPCPIRASRGGRPPGRRSGGAACFLRRAPLRCERGGRIQAGPALSRRRRQRQDWQRRRSPRRLLRGHCVGGTGAHAWGGRAVLRPYERGRGPHGHAASAQS